MSEPLPTEASMEYIFQQFWKNFSLNMPDTVKPKMEFYLRQAFFVGHSQAMLWAQIFDKGPASRKEEWKNAIQAELNEHNRKMRDLALQLNVRTFKTTDYYQGKEHERN